MSLIRLINNEIILGNEALLIKPIRDMFYKDKSTTKEKFYQQLSYMYFVYDPRSEYNWMEDENERIKAVIEQESLPKDFKPSKELKEAIKLYQATFTKNSALLLLQDSKIGFDKLRKFLKEVDYNESDDKNKPKYSITALVSALKQIPQLAKDFNQAQKEIEKDLEAEGKVRGGNDNISVLEDGM